MDQCRRIFQALGRRKTVDPKKLLISRFKRNLNISDLLGIGLGGSLGIGVYIVITYVIKHQAGPSAVISVIIASVAALLSGLCYSEFTSRLPQMGSSYVFLYASLGELSAFVIGWSMILENIVLAAAVSKAWSQYFDGLLNGTVHNYICHQISWTGSDVVSDCPDLLSAGILLLVGLLFLCNIKGSAVLLFLLAILNGLVIFCIICVGFFHVKHENWTDPPGFFPFGLTGIISGAGTLFCIFSCIDTVCSTSEETKEPDKIVPRAVIANTILPFILIMCITLALTLSYPWYEFEDAHAIPMAYHRKGVNGSYYVFSVGGLIGLTAALISFLNGIPRFLFPMKTDRLLYPCCLPKPETGINFKLIILPLFLTCLLSIMLTLNLLIELLAVGTLITYTCVAICVVNVRYQPLSIGLYQEYEDIDEDKFIQSTEFVYSSFVQSKPNNNNQVYDGLEGKEKNGFFNRLSYDPNNKFILTSKPRDSTYHKMDSVVNDTPVGSQSSLFQLPVDIAVEPTNSSSMTASVTLIVFVIATTVFAFVITFASDSLFTGAWWAVTCFFISVIILIISTAIIVKQPQNQTKLRFKTPYVPFVPLISIFLNMLMMSSLSYKAWLRYSVWMFLGLIIYVIYGMRHSAEKEIDDQEVVLYEISEQERT